jgi:2-methylcitrate dehydratase PrpD
MHAEAGPRTVARAMSGITQALGEWAATAPRDRGTIALERARDAIEDTVAVMVAGAGDEGAHAVRRVVAGYGDGAASVIGNNGQGAAAPFAALANGTSAHALDYDDNFLPGLTHASAVLVPALLALADAHDLSGARLVDAYITGLDVHAVLGRGTGRAHYDLGWHNTATVGCIGTAAACARLLELDADAVTRAISLGVSMAAGAKVQFGSAAKPYHAGMAAKNAVLAATLAAQGMDARRDAIEGARGFSALYAGEPDAPWDALLAAVRATPAIESSGLAPKLYPCCGSAHRVLDGVIALREQYGFRAVEVARVDATVGYGNQRNLCYPDPRHEMEARFSLEYCVAIALLEGRLTLADFTHEAVQRPQVRALFPRVHMHATAPGAEGTDPSARLPHAVQITLNDGRVLETSVLWARGTIAQPFTRSDRDAKFRDCCEGFLAPRSLAEARAALAGIATLASVRELTGHLRFQAGSDHGQRFTRRYAGAA